METEKDEFNEKSRAIPDELSESIRDELEQQKKENKFFRESQGV